MLVGETELGWSSVEIGVRGAHLPQTLIQVDLSLWISAGKCSSDFMAKEILSLETGASGIALWGQAEILPDPYSQGLLTDTK